MPSAKRVTESCSVTNLSQFDLGCASDSVVDTSSSIYQSKKGVPWTESEHRMFQLGLEKHGKEEDWRAISRNFVPTRTPEQLANHAQYFMRLLDPSRRNHRPSLFDMISTADKESNEVDGDGDNNGGNGDDDNNNGGGGGGGKSNKKDGGGDGHGHGNVDGGDRYEGSGGGGGKTKGLKMDSMGQPGFDYRYGYHAGCEFEYPVGQLQAPQIFHQENLIQKIQLEGEMDMSVNGHQDGKTFTNTTIHLKERLERTRNDNSIYSHENNKSNDSDGDGDHGHKNIYHAGYENRHPFGVCNMPHKFSDETQMQFMYIGITLFHV